MLNKTNGRMMMSFQKKVKAATTDSRPKVNKLEQREAKVKHLKDANTPEARRLLKLMNDKVYRGSRTHLGNWYAPKGIQTNAKYKPHKVARTQV